MSSITLATLHLWAPNACATMAPVSFWHHIPQPIIGLSPMDGVTDLAFRYIVARYGKPDVQVTEFVHVDELGDLHVRLAVPRHDEPEGRIGHPVHGREADDRLRDVMPEAHGRHSSTATDKNRGDEPPARPLLMLLAWRLLGNQNVPALECTPFCRAAVHGNGERIGRAGLAVIRYVHH